jgi:SAM-dependent methyltransferase
MIAKLGLGNAHPGGFAETLRFLKRHPLPVGTEVLEVGCGTGRTACLLAEMGCVVTALDIRPEMLAKAKIRAQRLQAAVQFVEGDACHLPFMDNEFDVVMVESVSNFAQNALIAVSEYLRVLKPGGLLYDREVIKYKDMPHHVYQSICDFYGVETMLAIQEWFQLLLAAGFTHVHHEDKRPFPPHMWEDTVHHPDPVRLADEQSLLNPEIWRLSLEYDELMERYLDYLGYTVLIGIK